MAIESVGSPTVLCRYKRCGSPAVAMGVCKKHLQEAYARVVSRLSLSSSTRCYLWMGARDRDGYGFIRVVSKLHRPHRVAWAVEHLEDPGDMHVLHTCDNPPCCNPDHLFLGTNEDNVRDKMEKGRHVAGETHGCSKLTWSQVREIRSKYLSGGTSQAQLGREYGVVNSVVSSIVLNQSWADSEYQPPEKNPRGAWDRCR